MIVPAAVALAATCVGDRPAARAIAALGADSPSRSPTLAVPAHLLRDRRRPLANPVPPAVGDAWSNVDAWLAACEWIRDHAPPDAVCLIPRHAQSFKWYAERADVVNWKDVPQDAAGVVEWRRRMQDVFPTVDDDEGPAILGSPEQWGARRATRRRARVRRRLHRRPQRAAAGPARSVRQRRGRRSGGGYVGLRFADVQRRSASESP